MKKFLILFLFILVCFVIAGAGGFITSSAIPTWYVTLKKPSFNPPSWVFGPAWTVLYICIAVSGWLIWLKKDEVNIKTVMIVYIIQLILNGLWTPIFFGLKKPGSAFIEICFMWISIGIYIILAKNISIPAMILFIPYWLWVTFASFLNFTIWQMNK